MTNPPLQLLPAAARYRSKSLAAWLALLGGALGLHRFYLRGLRDGLGWLHWPPTLLGLVGVQRLETLGQDDRLAWLLVPVLGLMLSLGALFAIIYGLTPDEKWDATQNPGLSGRPTTWAPVLAAVASLLVGGAVLMGTITYGVQMFFQWEMEVAQSGGQSDACGSRCTS